MKLSDTQRSVILNHGWMILPETAENILEIEGTSPLGAGVIHTIEIRDGERLAKAVLRASNEFDPDEYAAFNVAQRGKNGVPLSVRALINNAEAIKQGLLDLSDALAESDDSPVRNRLYQLTEAERAVVLKAMPGRKARGYEGETLGRFVDEEMGGSEALSELMDELSVWNLEWPFRKLYVTVELRAMRGYEIAVLDDGTVDAYANSTISLSNIDPDWDDSLESVAEEIAKDGICVGDYAVDDDEGRRLVDWND